MAAAPPDIVVWEWADESNLYIAYDPKISNEIEDIYCLGTPQPPFVISVSVPGVANLIRYKINLSNLDQTNERTGVTRAIRRTLSTSSALANDHTWQWQEWKHYRSGKGGKIFWMPYATELVEQIESAYLRGDSFLKFPPNYKVDFKPMIQTNTISGFQRKIRRVQLNGRYKIDQLSSSRHTTQPNPASPTSVQQSSQPAAVRQIPASTSQPLASSDGSLNSAGVQTAPLHHSPASSQSQNSSRTDSSSQQPLMHTYRWSLRSNIQPSSSHSKSSQAVTNATSASQNQANQDTSQTPGISKKIWRNRHVPWRPCPSGGVGCSTGGAAANVPFAQVLSSYTSKIQVDSNSTDQCSICQSDLTEESGFGNSKDTVELTLCKHVFHGECTEASYSHGVQNGCVTCPSCNKCHGVKTWDQPGGVMKYSSSPSSLPGYPGCGTIRIEYHITPGTQSSEHPNPGRSFGTPGFPRRGFIPDNDEGRSILYLLVEAWKRRLIFTVGRSSTTGMDDVVTWTGIHHKTSSGSYGGHGYPDPTYLERVRDELETVGVVDRQWDGPCPTSM